MGGRAGGAARPARRAEVTVLPLRGRPCAPRGGGPRLRQVAAVDDAQAGGRAELGPVGRAREPVHALAQERVHGRAGVHDRVGEDDRRVAHAVAHLHRALHVLQHLRAGQRRLAATLGH